MFTDPEDRDVLIIKATIQISQLLAGVDVDRAVRFFLLDVWSRVLVEIACGEATSARDATLARAKRLCTDLALSAAPKTTSGARARLAGVPRISPLIISRPPAGRSAKTPGMPNRRSCGKSDQCTGYGPDRAEHDGTGDRADRRVRATIPRMGGERQQGQGQGQNGQRAEDLHWYLQQGGGRI
jgi:hypothetical protein